VFLTAERRGASSGTAKEFRGVLVSDFYAAYDSPNAQQKCLIHLMRDINQELLNNRSTKNSGRSPARSHAPRHCPT